MCEANEHNAKEGMNGFTLPGVLGGAPIGGAGLPNGSLAGGLGGGLGGSIDGSVNLFETGVQVASLGSGNFLNIGGVNALAAITAVVQQQQKQQQQQQQQQPQHNLTQVVLKHTPTTDSLK